mmetsp:Transcript_9154/g.10568  ORF Transcript_9154/g.10568 Transcript_9154/m.10568 type:complete len:372 (+) Transcript_9154:85-1200(+)
MRVLLLLSAFATCTTGFSPLPSNNVKLVPSPLLGRTVTPVPPSTRKLPDLAAREAYGVDSDTPNAKPSALLPLAYTLTGLATATAWTTIIFTTITNNAPLGALMPNWQHPTVNQISVLSALPLLFSSIHHLRSAASTESWSALESDSCRRQNLGLVGVGLAGVLWVRFCATITKLPGTALSHASYKGSMGAALMAAYASTAVLSGAVWIKSLPTGTSILSLPTRITDGLSAYVCNLLPADKHNPVNVKYSVLTAGFTFLTLLQLLAPHPLAVIPSWTGRRISRAFPMWTMLAAVTSYDLKLATEAGTLFEPKFRQLSRGLRAFGLVHVISKIGAIFLDPTFPASYHAVALVPGWAAAAILFFGLTLRGDKQ